MTLSHNRTIGWLGGCLGAIGSRYKLACQGRAYELISAGSVLLSCDRLLHADLLRAGESRGVRPHEASSHGFGPRVEYSRGGRPGVRPRNATAGGEGLGRQHLRVSEGDQGLPHIL